MTVLLIQLCCVSIKLPSYLYEIVPTQQRSRPNPIYVKSPRCRRELFQNFYQLLSVIGVNLILGIVTLIPRCRRELFGNSFLPFTISDQNKFDIRNSDSYSLFSKFYKACRKKVFTMVMIPLNLNFFIDCH